MTRPPAPTVRLVICGNPDRADDGVARIAGAQVLASLPAALRGRLELRLAPELRLEDLVDLPPGHGCVIADAVAGPTPGRVVVLPIDRLAAGIPFSPRSSHQLPLPLVVGVAAALRGGPLDGAFVGLAGERWALGGTLSPAVRAALPAYRGAIVAEVLRRIAAPVGDAVAAARQGGG